MAAIAAVRLINSPCDTCRTMTGPSSWGVASRLCGGVYGFSVKELLLAIEQYFGKLQIWELRINAIQHVEVNFVGLKGIDSK